jgi:AcrR family transcriptional regulator
MALQIGGAMGQYAPVFKSLADYPPGAQQLMTTAERLYGQHGVDGISLRQLVTAAGQGNNYAVQHHFGSKLGLIKAVSEMRLPALEAERQAMLDAAARDGDFSLERMLGATLIPLVTLLGEEDLEHYARFSLAVMSLDPYLHPFVTSVPVSTASTEIRDRLAERLPHLPADVLRRRLSLAVGLFLNAASQLGGQLRLSTEGYSSRRLYFQDAFDASVAVLSAPFPPRVYPGCEMDAIDEPASTTAAEPEAAAQEA